jgi:hypothetical protein
MAQIFKKYTYVEVLGADPLPLAALDDLLRSTALRVYGHSALTGDSRQGYTPGIGGTLTQLLPGYGYEVVSKGTAINWDMPGVRALYGSNTPVAPPADPLPTSSDASLDTNFFA